MESAQMFCPERFVTLSEENIDTESLCCIVRKKQHHGIEAKREWLHERLAEGHIFRKVASDGCAFIEYAPLETAWVPIVGDNYLYIYCLWVDGPMKGHGYGNALMESCLRDAENSGKSGVCMLGAVQQKAWLSSQSFAMRYGFQTVDTTDYGYLLLAKSFDGTVPHFPHHVKTQILPEWIQSVSPEQSGSLIVIYSCQCPFIPGRIENLQQYCLQNQIPAQFIPVHSLDEAKSLPCVFNNWAVFYNGRFVTVNQIDKTFLDKYIRKHL